MANYDKENKRTYGRTYYLKNKEKIIQRMRLRYQSKTAEIRQYGRDHYKKNVAKYKDAGRKHYISLIGRASAILSTARERSPETFELTKEWLMGKLETGVCEVTGLPFVFDGEPHCPWSPSVDRIDNAVGYTVANSRAVVWILNRAKGTATDADVLRFAEALCTANKS